MAGMWNTPTMYHSCEVHGKRGYTSRKLAKAGIRRTSNSKGMRAYACDVVEGMWHIGHLPEDVTGGRRTAADIYGRRSDG